MARIVGVDLPSNKRGEIALTYIYGIGRSSARAILSEAGIDYDLKVKDWNDDQLGAIRHRLGLPVRGQSTKNNARTRKGKKKTVANKKKATK